jgi:ribosome-binding protein aMBF1 (putative translation factor)
MNTKPRKNVKEIVENIKHSLNTISEEDQIDIEASVLMLNFLAEIENIQKIRGIDRMSLAKSINVSPSYLTQVFSGNKPLNFKTLAKIQKALNISFEVKSIERKKDKNIKLKKMTECIMSFENEFDKNDWTW